ncbi:hypothetical protein SprV_0100185900 [Sparganum proliferum]
MGTQHPSPCSMVCVDGGVEVTKDNQLIRIRHGRQEGVQALVEFVSSSVKAGHRGDVYTNGIGEFGSQKRRAEAHQSAVDALQQTGQSSHDVAPDGKGDARVASICFWAAAPEVTPTSPSWLWSEKRVLLSAARSAL